MDPKSIQGVELLKIKNVSAVDITQKWEILYEVDFTTQVTASVPWSAGGRYKNKRIVVKKIGTDELSVIYFNPNSTYIELA